MRTIVTTILVASCALGAEASPIDVENAQSLGVTGWSQVFPGAQNNGVLGHELEFYVSRTQNGAALAGSLEPGDTLRIHASSVIPGESATLAIYRIGWYGASGRVRQVYPAPESGVVAPSLALQNRHTTHPCLVSGISLVECPWPATNSLPLTAASFPRGIPTGVYVAKLTSTSGWNAFATFVVREPPSARAPVLAMLPVTTYEAYNGWSPGSTSDTWCSPGQRNFYCGSSASGFPTVSFDRPSLVARGLGELTAWGDIDAISFIESPNPDNTSLHYDVSYITDVDLHRDAGMLANRSGLVSLGHDEYWSLTARTRVRAELDGHMKLAFLGANSVYWNVEFSASSAGVSDRRMATNKQNSTHLFRQMGLPEYDVMGTEFDSAGACINGSTPSSDFRVVDSSGWLFDSTGLLTNGTIAGVISGEWNRRSTLANTPLGIEVAASFDPLVGTSCQAGNAGGACTNPAFCWSSADRADMTSFRGLLGARVFSASTLGWQQRLNAFDTSATGVVVRRITRNVLNDQMGIRHVARSKLALANTNCSNPSEAVMLTDAGDFQSRFRVMPGRSTSVLDPGLPVTQWASGEGGWSFGASKVVGRNSTFNAGCNEDVAVFYDRGALGSGVQVFLGGNNTLTPNGWWWTGASPAWAASQVAAGDANGDGRTDIIVLENLGNATSRLWVLRNVSDGVMQAEQWWTSGVGQFNANVSKLAVGDVTGDGRGDVVILYDLGAGTSRLFVFPSTGTGYPSGNTWWTSGAGAYTWSRATPVVGRFRSGINRSDLAILYDAGNATAAIHVFRSNLTSFLSGQTWWSSGAGNFSVPDSQIVAGDIDRNGIDDIMALYRGAYTRVESFASNGSTAFTRSSGSSDYSP